MAYNGNYTGRQIRPRCYTQTSTGPFIVIAESVDGILQLSKLTKLVIRDFGHTYVKAVSMSRRKAKFLMASAVAANSLSSTQYDAVKWNIPQRLVECLGVASIVDVDDEELRYLIAFEKAKLYQTNNPEVIEVRRMQKKDVKGSSPLPLVVITFSGKVLPSHVELDNVLYPVRQYNYPVRQCRQCWRFGHMSKQCKSKPRCNSCYSENVDENHECIGGPICVNCSGDHRANDRNKCPSFGKKREEEKRRQTSFSQGKNDWFVALASNIHEIEYLESTSVENSDKNVVTLSTQEETSAHTITVVTSASTDEDASGLKRKSSENNDISDDESYPPLKVRSTFLEESIISSDDEQSETEEISISHHTHIGAEYEVSQEENDVIGNFTDTGSNVRETENPLRLISADSNSEGKEDIPKRL